MDHCVKTKDHLLNLLWESDQTDTQLTNVETVLTVLENTEGLWQEANYCYKANEIATHCENILRSIETTNHKRRSRIESMKLRSWAMQTKYSCLQQDKIAADLEAQARLFGPMFGKTNMELAS